MPRVFLVHDSCPDFQTIRSAEAIARGVGEGIQVRTLTLGAGGDFANVPSAAIGLRREADGSDVVHAWGMAALASVAFAPFGRVVFTPTSFPNRRQLGWLRAIMH